MPLMEAASPNKRKQTDGSLVVNKKKRKTSGASAPVEAARVETPMPSAQHSGLQPQQQEVQKKKKNKKKKKPLADAPAETVPAATQPAEANGLHSSDASCKKPKSKKKKKQQAANGAHAEAPAAAPKASVPAAKALATDTTSAVRAVVGDQGLADSLSPIIKHLYLEAPSVAAMTATEVDSWRTERSTGIKGCELNPVTTFKDAGVLETSHNRLALHTMTC